ncbi:MAG: 2-dehydro-3-deoxygalactonokinase [Lewinella sp.]
MATTYSEYFISCDWGTTNFRLRVVERETLMVRKELATGTGIRQLNKDFQESGERSRLHFFAGYLQSELAQLPGEFQQLPIVASGMASSSIGLQELPYASLPFGADGDSLVSRLLPVGDYRLLLVSGVQGSGDIMRGEEVQAIGLAGEMKEDGLLILPGTHAKHLIYRNGTFTDFTTYMTGELFELLSLHSILSGSVAPGTFDDGEREAFLEGVDAGQMGRLTGSLFGVRVRDVVDHLAPSANYNYLSGLVIGEELRHLPADNGRIYLAATGATHERYRLALERLVLKDRLTVFHEPVVERALLSAHYKLLLQHA